MKTLFLMTVAATIGLLLTFNGQAQYKGPRDYFPKNSPAPPPKNGTTPPAAPKNPDQATPAKPQQLLFKDIPVNTQFFFTTDTNRSIPWTKVSATTAKNTKNGTTRALKGEMPVKK